MPIKKYLLAPGPTTVPPEVLLATAQPVMLHRTKEFSAILTNIQSGLKELFGTQNPVLTLASSGTGAMEAALVNMLSDGDSILTVENGKFGERWAKIAKGYNLKVHTLRYEWGSVAKADDVAANLRQFPEIKAVFMQGCETSTTVYNPLKEIAAAVKAHDDVILVVDGITSVGVYETNMDEIGVDVMLTGSQKAMMLPPGLSFLALSDKALARMKTSNLPRHYFNLNIEYQNFLKNTTAWTPAVNLIYGLEKSLEIMRNEGFANIYKRHELCANATRAAVKALELEFVAKENPSNAVTGLYLPDNIDGKAFTSWLRENAGITFAGGQGKLEGRIVRIAHLGYHSQFDTIVAISALEMGLIKFGAQISPGKGLAAAQAELLKPLA